MYTDSEGNIVLKICKILFSEERKQKLCTTKNLRRAPVSGLVWALETWPMFLKWFATTGQLSRGTPCSPWGRIYDFIQDVWNAVILAGFQETKEGGSLYIHLHPFQSACCQWSFNDSEQRQNVGYRMGTMCFVRMAKKIKKIADPSVSGSCWCSEKQGCSRKQQQIQRAPIRDLSSRSWVLVLSDLLKWSVIIQRELSLWK